MTQPWPPGRAGIPASPSDTAAAGYVSSEQPARGSITVLPLMRVELRPGQTYRNASDGKVTSRVEAYGRPDPPGSTRWYDVAVYFPDDFPTVKATTWLIFTQWKGLTGGSPPIALEVKRDHLRLGGSRTNAGLIPNDGNLGPIPFGAWIRLTVGICHAAGPADGWVTVYRDGALIVPQIAISTLDTNLDGTPDPTYLKQGIYRSKAWTQPHVLWFAPTLITDDKPDDLDDFDEGVTA